MASRSSGIAWSKLTYRAKPEFKESRSIGDKYAKFWSFAVEGQPHRALTDEAHIAPFFAIVWTTVGYAGNYVSPLLL